MAVGVTVYVQSRRRRSVPAMQPSQPLLSCGGPLTWEQPPRSSCLAAVGIIVGFVTAARQLSIHGEQIAQLTTQLSQSQSQLPALASNVTASQGVQTNATKALTSSLSDINGTVSRIDQSLQGTMPTGLFAALPLTSSDGSCSTCSVTLHSYKVLGNTLTFSGTLKVSPVNSTRCFVNVPLPVPLLAYADIPVTGWVYGPDYRFVDPRMDARNKTVPVIMRTRYSFSYLLFRYDPDALSPASMSQVPFLMLPAGRISFLTRAHCGRESLCLFCSPPFCSEVQIASPSRSLGR
jgi:hypothetical protein